jgi:hypothetical protein
MTTMGEAAMQIPATNAQSIEGRAKPSASTA